MGEWPQGRYRGERSSESSGGSATAGTSAGGWPVQPPAQAAPGGGRRWPRPRTDWLITGSTGALTTLQEDQLHAGHDVDDLSDTIMLLHIPGNGGPPVLVSIPRDSYVPIPGHGQNKINAAFASGGPQLLAQTVETVTGLRISHYVALGYTGLVSVVNAVGGVRMCLPGPMADPKAGLSLSAGCQTLTGTQALGYVRTRQVALGDLQRVQDQRVLVKALVSKVTSPGTLVNPLATIPAAIGSVDALTVDQGTHLYQLAQVAFALRSPQATTVPFGGFEDTAVGSVVLWDQAKAQQLVSDLAKDKPEAGPVRIRPGRGQLPTDSDGLPARGQRLLPPAQISQPHGLIGQRHRQAGPERIRPGRGQLPVGADGLPARRQRLLQPPQVRLPHGLIGQRHRQAGPERIRPGRGQFPVGADGLPARGQRLLRPPQIGQPVGLIVQECREAGPERIRLGRGQLPVDGDGLAG